MVDDTLLALINGSLDGTLSAAEEERLKHLLATDPSAKTVYEELREVTGILQRVPAVEPPTNLGQNILRQVRLSPAYGKPRSSWFAAWLGKAEIKPKLRLAFVFSGGLALGALFISLVVGLEQKTGLPDSGLAGTLILNGRTAELATVGTAVLRHNSIQANLEAKRFESVLVAELNVAVDHGVHVELEYDLQQVHLTGFRRSDRSNSPVSVEKNTVSVYHEGKNRYLFVFEDLTGEGSSFRVLLRTSEGEIRELSVHFPPRGS